MDETTSGLLNPSPHPAFYTSTRTALRVHAMGQGVHFLKRQKLIELASSEQIDLSVVKQPADWIKTVTALQYPPPAPVVAEGQTATPGPIIQAIGDFIESIIAELKTPQGQAFIGTLFTDLLAML